MIAPLRIASSSASPSPRKSRMTLEGPSVVDPVTGLQLGLLSDATLHFRNERSEIAPSYIGRHGHMMLTVLAIDVMQPSRISFSSK